MNIPERKPMPRGQSPRVDLESADLEDIKHALDSVGHCVLENALDPAFMTGLFDPAARRFALSDEHFRAGDRAPSDAVPESYQQYLGCFIGYDELIKVPGKANHGADANAFFDDLFEMFANSPLRRVFHGLFDGDFVMFRSECFIRRADPKFPLRFTGLHIDNQLQPCSEFGLQSKRAFTVWAPLQDVIADDIARLLLLKRGAGYEDLFSADERITERQIEFLPIQLKPYQIEDESQANERDLVRHAVGQFDRLFSQRGEQCYAPRLPAGAVVLFESDILHGSYVRPDMTKPRYSLDFRFTGAYETAEPNAIYAGRKFRLS